MNASDRYWQNPIQNPAVPTSGFQFGLNGANDSSQLSLSNVSSDTNAVSRIASPQNSDWRFQDFRGSTTQPYNQIANQGLLPNGLTPVSHAPGATTTSPDAYNQISSAPPEQRQQYGWGQ